MLTELITSPVCARMVTAVIFVILKSTNVSLLLVFTVLTHLYYNSITSLEKLIGSSNVDYLLLS